MSTEDTEYWFIFNRRKIFLKRYLVTLKGGLSWGHLFAQHQNNHGWVEPRNHFIKCMGLHVVFWHKPYLVPDFSVLQLVVATLTWTLARGVEYRTVTHLQFCACIFRIACPCRRYKLETGLIQRFPVIIITFPSG